MGYTVELSFNILKAYNVNEMQNEVIDMAQEYGCATYYVDFEMENEYLKKRNHCIITLHFEKEHIYSMIEFLKYIKCLRKCYIETIYCNDSNHAIYISRHCLIQNSHSLSAKEYKSNQNTRKYSLDEEAILNAVKANHLW